MLPARLPVPHRSRFVALAFLALLPMPVAVAGPDAPAAVERHSDSPIQELFLTDTIYTQGKGEVQLGLMPAFQKWRDLSVLQLEASVEVGLTNSWQADLEWTGYQLQEPVVEASAEGIGDVEIGTQYSFMNLAGGKVSVAPRLAIQFPLGDV